MLDTATRIEDIASQAGITKGTVYLYFGSRDEILLAASRRADRLPVPRDPGR
ncbi:MAG: helix-turn-helix domain-containing protein [Rubrobacteraceae bacterium]